MRICPRANLKSNISTFVVLHCHRGVATALFIVQRAGSWNVNDTVRSETVRYPLRASTFAFISGVRRAEVTSSGCIMDTVSRARGKILRGETVREREREKEREAAWNYDRGILFPCSSSIPSRITQDIFQVSGCTAKDMVIVGHTLISRCIFNRL